MKTVSVLVALLVVTNLLLAGVLLVQRSGPSLLDSAEAQTVSRGSRYLMVTGNISSNRQCVYLVDERTNRLFVFMWDEPKEELRALAGRNLAMIEQGVVEDKGE
jgi:hypothetical protein